MAESGILGSVIDAKSGQDFHTHGAVQLRESSIGVPYNEFVHSQVAELFVTLVVMLRISRSGCESIVIRSHILIVRENIVDIFRL